MLDLGYEVMYGRRLREIKKGEEIFMCFGIGNEEPMNWYIFECMRPKD